MGNTIQLKSNNGKFFRTRAQENFVNDPSAFRVFVKKRNKFIPGWLKINDEEILFLRGGNNFQYWPLAYLRRYGYTCSGIFFFESGRRCATGEGLHTFQSHQAERIFYLVQSKIKIEEYARGSSRASSVLSTRTNGINPPLSANSRIHPVQRFSSEGTSNDFLLNPTQSGTANRPTASSPQPSTLYTSYNEGTSSAYNGAASPSYQTPRSQLQKSTHRPFLDSEALYRHRRYPPNTNSNGNVNPMARIERPRSVVSAIEHGVIYPTTRPSNDSSASSMIGMSIPYNTANNLMNRSYNSAIGVGYTDSNGAYSPWQSQQQLEGEIVMEHVLSNGKKLQHPETLHSFQRSYGGISEPQKYHSYVNVDLSSSLTSHQIRELHRTSKSRQEFLSSQPGGFVFSSTNNQLGLPNRAPSAASSVATASTILPPLSPPENNSKALYTPFNHQNGNLLTSKQHCSEDLMSKSAFATLPHTNRITECEFASLRVPSPAASLETNNKKNYITVPVGMQEKKLQNQSKLANNNSANNLIKSQQSSSGIMSDSVANNNSNETTTKDQIGINYALIDFDKTKTLEKVTNNLKQQKQQENLNNSFS